MMNHKTAILKFLEEKQTLTSIALEVIKQIKNLTKEFLMFVPDVPFSFSRQGRKYKGFYAFGPKHILRFEAYDSDPKTLVSIAVWETGDSLSESPDYIVHVQDFADSETIAKSLVGSYAPQQLGENIKIYREAAKDETVEEFLNEVGYHGESINTLYRKYLRWADAKDVKPISNAAFYNKLKAYKNNQKSTPEEEPSSGITVEKGIKDDAPALEPEYDEFEQELLNNSVLYKYAMIEEIVKKIVTWDPLYRNAFIYGVGGVGKTHTVMQVVNEYADKDRVVSYTGAVSGFTGLLQVLWENREGKIIIFDDNDAMLENVNALNLLKGAMENRDPRILSYIRFKRTRAPVKAESADLVIDVSKLHENLVSIWQDGEKIAEEVVTPREARWYERISGSFVTRRPHLYEDDEYEDDEYEDDDYEENIASLDPEIDPAYGMDASKGVPDRFQFTSRIIFISNLMKVPQPLMDRCISIGLLLTKQQILDLIDSKLEHLMKDAPEVSLEEKRKVLAFMQKYVHRIGKPLTFRLFQQLVAIYHSGHPDALKMMYLTMMGEGLQSKLR